jgi:uncharacterized protein YjbJ (UPF0337 family)
MAKSAARDKTEGAADKLKGRAREAAGALTGNESEKAKGQGDQLKGTAKNKKGHLKDLVK